MVARVDALVEDVGKRSTLLCSDEEESLGIVNGSLMFGEDDERATLDIDSGIESRSIFAVSDTHLRAH